jgi:hypothetical protein
MAGSMGDADELRIIAETLAPMSKHVASRLLEIAARVEARDAILERLGQLGHPTVTPAEQAAENGEG